MSKIEFKSMAQRITIPIVVILIVVCAGMGIISYKISANTVTKEIEETLLNFSRQNADKILTEIKKDFHVLEITAYLDLIKSPEVKIDDKLSVLRSVIEMTSFRNMGIVDLEGTLIITNNQEMDVTDREYFQQALRGETYVGDPVISRADGTLALVSATPIYVGDSIKGVLMGERDASFLNDMTAEMGYGKRGYAFITNSEGVLVAHDNIELIKNEVDYRELAKTDPGYAGAAQLIEKMVEQEHGTLRYHFAGEDRFSGYHPIGNTGWSLGMSCYESDILAGAIRIRNIIIALSLCAIILGTVFSLWLGKSSLAVLAGASQFANVMAGGDFSVELPDDALGRKDEIGDLAKSFDRMQKSLGEMFSNIKQGADRVYDSSETLASSSEEMSASLEEVSASTNEFASNAQHLSESSERMYELGNQVSERAQGGYQAVEKAVSQMETISGSVSELQENVTFLNSEAGKVGNIIDTIKGIAGQTNLLALNAAIEAARAGEQGRGFAVVAEEVRKLAEQSASSAEKITVIIESIQAGVYGVSQQMAEAVKDVESGTEAVLFSGEALRSIVDEIQGIASQIDQVAATTQEISSGSEELSAAVEEQTATMNEISNAAVDLRGLVEDLNDAVNKFIF